MDRCLNEADIDAGLIILEDEQVNEEKGSQEKSSPLGKQSTVIMTGDGEESVRGSTPCKETRGRGIRA